MTMTTYVARNGKIVEKAAAGPRLGPQIMSDTAAYRSPVCDASGRHPVIEGRRARREDLKRNGCREYDPGELRDYRKAVERDRAELRAIAAETPYIRMPGDPSRY